MSFVAVETMQDIPSMSYLPDKPQDVASKVLRRAQVSKMTRALQDRLALANVKIRNGWQDRSIDSIEPEIDRLEVLKRKRSDSASDTSSVSGGGRVFSSSVLPSSSPMTAPIFSDEVVRSGASVSKRFRIAPRPTQPSSSVAPRNTIRPSLQSRHTTSGAIDSWKSTYRLSESSPIKHRQQASGGLAPKPTPVKLNNSFVSTTSTIPDSPSESEDDDQDLPLHSFQMSQHTSTQITSSPPRTPPPNLARSARLRSKAFSSPPDVNHHISAHAGAAGREGADLLLYLASSPSPAMRVSRPNSESVFAPTTPPTKHTPLPSSMLGTPGLFGFGMGGPNTPSTAFNFADFVNVTPSPAQGPWSKTPNVNAKTPVAGGRTPLTGSRTPGAVKEARRRLNFDGMPPPMSPDVARRNSGSKRGQGLGMELGGELHHG